MRVNELSKELGKTNKEVLEILQKNQFDVKSHASSISDDQADYCQKNIGRRACITKGGDAGDGDFKTRYRKGGN